MELKVEVVSKDTIKPSSPTPIDLRNYKLSYIDQLAARFYVPIVLLYDQKHKRTSLSHDHLKKSVSLTLTQMYPLAGRLKDMLSIECNDQGVDYIGARVDDDISRVLQCPELVDVLKMLLPYDPHDVGQVLPLHDEPLLAVQVNEFSCGGIAIGVCIRHVIADIAGTVAFLKKWADQTNIINEPSNNISIDKEFVFDCSSLSPPLASANHSSTPGLEKKETKISKGFIIRRFCFSETDVVALQELAKHVSDDVDDDDNNKKNHHRHRHPTRVEAVTAFIWKAVIGIARARSTSIKTHSLMLSVNLRNRMLPPFPPHAIGNFAYLRHFEARSDDQEDGGGVVDYKALTRQVGESIELVTDGYVRKVFSEGTYFKEISSNVESSEEKTSDRDNMGISIGITSWCRFPFYEIDFGWGKPVFVGNSIGTSNTVVLMDTSDGKGIQAWIALAEKDMQELEHNPEFLSHCSLIPITSNQTSR